MDDTHKILYALIDALGFKVECESYWINSAGHRIDGNEVMKIRNDPLCLPPTYTTEYKVIKKS